MGMMQRRTFIVFAGVGGALLAIVLWFDLWTPDVHALAAQMRAAGPLGPIALFALFVLQCIVAPLPSEPLMMAAGFVYGPALGFAIGWFGVVSGAAACFGLARALGRPLAQRFVRAERLGELDAYVENRGLAATFAIVLGIRLFAFMSFDAVSYGCGLLRFPFRWFLLASAVGVVPKVFAFTYAGASVAARPAWLDGVILAGTFGSLLVLPWLVRRRHRAASQASFQGS